jgi:hypothetical protein
MFTVSQYDGASYLFTDPTFISLDPTVTPDNIVVKGIRIGINGAIPTVGQAYIPLNTTVTASAYTSLGEVLSKVGTVIALQSGPLVDQFFLSFDQLGTKTHVTVEASPVPTTPTDLAPVSGIGVRTFAQINSSFSLLTGVPTTQPAVLGTYQAVQQQLPAIPTLESFSSANQVGIAQLAVQYCNVAITTPALQAKLFPGVTFGATLFNAQTGIDQVTSALAARVLGTGISSQPAAATVTGELSTLIHALCLSTSCTNNQPRVIAVTTAACAAALGSSDVLMN